MIYLNRNAIWHIHWIDGFHRGTIPKLGIYKPRAFVSIVRIANFLLKLLMAKILKIKIIWSIHNVSSHEYHNTIYEAFVTKILLRKASKITAFNKHIIKEIRKRYNFSGDISLMRQGLYEGCYPDNVTKSQARNKFGISENNVVFLLFGHLEEYKGVDILIKAIRIINSDEIKVIIAGSPKHNLEYAGFIRKIASNDDRIILWDRYIRDDEVQYFFRAADYTIYPYRRIDNSGVLFLTYTFGIPCVVSNRGGVKEIAELEPEVCMLIDNPTVDNVADAIKAAMNNKTDATCAMKRMQERLSWKHITPEILQVFNSCDVQQ